MAFAARDATHLDPDAGAPPYGIDGSGWIADVTLKGLGAGGTVDASKLTVIVTDPGFDTSGNAITRTRAILGRAVVRRQYPNQTSRLIATSGSDVLMRISLSDYIYSGSTITAVTIASGFYTGCNASSNPTITNSSTLAYFKPAFAWLNIQHERVTADYPVEAVVYHRHAMNGQQVACVKFDCADASANAAATQTCSAPALSSLITQGFPPEAWKATIPLTSLAQGSICQVSAKVYPWIGTAWDLAADAVAWPTAQTQTKLRFKNDKTGAYGGAIAYVRAGVAYTAISSGDFSGTYAASNAFDGTTAEWATPASAPSAYIGTTFPTAVVIREISVTGASVTTTLTAWKAEFSDDGASWTQKGANTAFSTFTAGQVQTHDLGTADVTAHRYWRISRVAGTSQTGVREMTMELAVAGATAVGGLVSTVTADARSLPYPTINGALAAIKTFNNTNKSHNDHSGGSVFLMDDGASGAVTHSPTANSDTVTAGDCWTEIRPDPSAVGAVAMSATGNFQLADRIKIRVNVKGSAFATLYDGTSNGNRMISLDGVSCDLSTQTSFHHIYGWGLIYNRNVAGTNTPTGIGNSINTHITSNTTRSNSAMLAGCVQNSGSERPINTHMMVGCNFSGAYVNSAAYTLNDSLDGMVLANNRLQKLPGSNATINSNAAATRAAAFVQNIFESSGTIIPFNFMADSDTGAVYEVIEHHNLIIGDRGSRMYAENAGARGFQRRGSTRFNLQDKWNIKSDTFASGFTGNCGNWAYKYQVGLLGNVVIKGSTDGTTAADPNGIGYLGEYIEPGSNFNATATNVGFTNPQAVGWGGGTGGGDYHLVSTGTNQAYNRVPSGLAVLSRDIAGTARKNDGTGAAGAYEG